MEVDLSGNKVAGLEQPPHPLYSEGPYKPTSVAVDEPRFGGAGDVWVADGHGQSLVHRFAADGAYLSTLTGEEGAGRFDCPHAVLIDRRAEPELYVADRGNARIQVYSLDGRYKRVFGEAELSGSTAVAPHEELLLVVENWPPRITVLDAVDRVVGTLCEDPRGFEREGWPNGLDADRGSAKVPDARTRLAELPTRDRGRGRWLPLHHGVRDRDEADETSGVQLSHRTPHRCARMARRGTVPLGREGLGGGSASRSSAGSSAANPVGFRDVPLRLTAVAGVPRRSSASGAFHIQPRSEYRKHRFRKHHLRRQSGHHRRYLGE